MLNSVLVIQLFRNSSYKETRLLLSKYQLNIDKLKLMNSSRNNLVEINKPSNKRMSRFSSEVNKLLMKLKSEHE